MSDVYLSIYFSTTFWFLLNEEASHCKAMWTESHNRSLMVWWACAQIPPIWIGPLWEKGIYLRLRLAIWGFAYDSFESIALTESVTSLLEQQVAWAFATAGVRRLDVMNTLAMEMMCRDDFSLQAIANISWAFRNLEIQHVALSSHLAGLVARRLIEVNGVPSRQDVDSLLGILWAFKCNEALTTAITSSLQSLGRKMDRATIDSQDSSEIHHIEALHKDDPQVVLRAPGVIVIGKPGDWEVDTERSTEESGGNVNKLSTFIDRLNLGFKDGFISRLDTPSSGLLLHALCYEGLFWLQAQRELGLLERDYLVLCRAWFPRDLSEISLKLRRMGRRVEASPYGRPACTRVKLLAHLLKPRNPTSPTSPVSLLALRIETGRTHQIRSHLATLGYPVVGDYRYSKKPVKARQPESFEKRDQWEITSLCHVEPFCALATFPKCSLLKWRVCKFV